MRRTLAALVVLALAAGFVAGCGQSRQEAGEDRDPPDIPARSISDGAEKYDPLQAQCPVCGEPIHEEYHAEVEYEGNSGRIYFDKKECEETFKGDPEQYLEGYTRGVERQKMYQKEFDKRGK